MGASAPNDQREYSRAEVMSWVGDARVDTRAIEHNAQVNAALSSVLQQYHVRDVASVRGRIEDIQRSLADLSRGGPAQLNFGGSISNRTSIDGLIDADLLVFYDGGQGRVSTPQELLDALAERLRRELANQEVSVRTGLTAVTVAFPDGTDIQLVPAVRDGSTSKVPSGQDREWYSVDNLDVLAQQLGEADAACDGRLVPVIKLVKSMLAHVPRNIRPTGYHVADLAIQVFREYSGPTNYKDMIQQFFDRASELVLDRSTSWTGPLSSIDEHFGPGGSRRRRYLSRVMRRLARRIAIADRMGSVNDWLDLVEG